MPAVATTHRLVRVTRNRPCPVCHRTDWCLIAPDEQTGVCMRSGQGRQVDMGGAGTGWAWGERDKPAMPLPPLPATQDAPRDWEAILHASMVNGGDDLGDWPGRLSVSKTALKRLGAVQEKTHERDKGRGRLLVPMWDAHSRVVGVHVRSRDGFKCALTGSHNGLYLPDAGLPDCLDTIWVCEGASDCAALLDLGVYAVGRTGCTGCGQMVRRLCYGLHLRIMADRDEPKQRPDGSTWCPGQYGAEQLARACYGHAASIKIVYPSSGKDVRAWKMINCTPSVLACVERATAAWKPTREKRH